MRPGAAVAAVRIGRGAAHFAGAAPHRQHGAGAGAEALGLAVRARVGLARRTVAWWNEPSYHAEIPRKQGGRVRRSEDAGDEVRLPAAVRLPAPAAPAAAAGR